MTRPFKRIQSITAVLFLLSASTGYAENTLFASDGVADLILSVPAASKISSPPKNKLTASLTEHQSAQFNQILYSIDTIAEREENNQAILQELNSLLFEVTPRIPVQTSTSSKEAPKKSAESVRAIPKSAKEKSSPGKEVLSFSSFIQNNPVLRYAFDQLGKPYVWGATGPESFDCSGFTVSVFKKASISLPRTSSDQSQSGQAVDKSRLSSGDLVFFDTSTTPAREELSRELLDSPNLRRVTHVGIYIGDNKFIHASSGSKKVILSDLTHNYYSTRYVTARRYD